MGKQTAAAILAVIVDLEKKIPLLQQAVADRESELANGYAEGTDTDTPLSALARAKDALSGALAGLVQLDRKWFEQAKIEREEGEARVRAKVDDIRARFEVEVKKAFAEKIGPLIGDDTLTAGMVGKIIEMSEEVFWDRHGRLTAQLPPSPREPGQRGPDGRPLSAREIDALWLTRPR